MRGGTQTVAIYGYEPSRIVLVSSASCGDHARYEQYDAGSPNHTLDDFLNAFKKRFIGGRKVQTSLRDEFYDISKYTGTLEEA